MKYFIEFKRTALKDLEKINKKDAIAIMSKIKIMEAGLSGDIIRSDHSRGKIDKLRARI